LDSCLAPYLKGDEFNAFFQRTVVGIYVWGGSHFSKVFIFNANKVLTREYWHPQKQKSDLAPCILFANSATSNGTKTHNPVRVAEVVRFFLNALDKKINNSAGKHFNTTTMPIYQLDGKNDMLTMAARGLYCWCC
jgi:hypothetical protein